MSDYCDTQYISVELDAELWASLRKHSGFFAGQANFLFSFGKPLPERYQFGVGSHFLHPQANFDLLVSGLTGKGEYRISDLGSFLDICEYLFIDELTIVGILCGSEGGYTPPENTFLELLYRCEDRGFARVASYLYGRLGLVEERWHQPGQSFLEFRLAFNQDVLPKLLEQYRMVQTPVDGANPPLHVSPRKEYTHPLLVRFPGLDPVRGITQGHSEFFYASINHRTSFPAIPGMPAPGLGRGACCSRPYST